jgi:hypothetical protein
MVIATLALISVAGFQGRLVGPNLVESGQVDPYGASLRAGPPRVVSSITSLNRPVESTFRAAVSVGIGGKIGCAMLLIFGAAALAPTTYSSYVLGRRLHAALPRLSRTQWTLVGIALAWTLVALGWVERLERVFTLMGALFAPVVGCMAAEYVRHKGTWPGPRRGVNLPGLVGWAFGLAVGLIPFAGGRLAWFQPAAFWAFVAAFVVYRVVAAVAGEAPPAPPIKPTAEPELQGIGAVAETSLPTAATTSDSTVSAQGDGSP